MLLWDSVLRMLLDEAQDSRSDPEVAKDNGVEVDTSYERWYRAQLYLDRQGYEKRLNGLYELLADEEGEDGVEGKLEKERRPVPAGAGEPALEGRGRSQVSWLKSFDWGRLLR